MWVGISGSFFARFFLQRQVFGESRPDRPDSSVVPREKAQTAADGYVGSAGCARCHAAIYASFSRTHMGRSLVPVTPEMLSTLHLPGSVYNQQTDRHFSIFARAGKLYVSEFQTGAQGEDVFRDTQPIGWILGGDANGFGGIVQRGSYLFEAPVSYYTAPGEWDVSPGYETRTGGFNRPILAGCISCHSGRPQPADQDTGKFKPVPFEQFAIGCENCHGPGAEHVRAMEKTGGLTTQSFIVNPNKLSAELENNICMSCHEGGDARIARPGKTYQDFRPGQPLDDTLSIFMVPLKRDDPQNEDHLQQYFEMRLSKCYRASAGQLRCATCHDPHVEPTSAAAAAYFNTKCMDCHVNHMCTLPAAARARTTPEDNCIGCHMPRRTTPKIAHSSLTNHRIPARAAEPLPDEAFAMTTSELPDLVHLNRVPGRKDALPATTLLQAYREIANQHPEYEAAYQRTLSEAERTDPNHAKVQEQLARRELNNGNAQQAVRDLQRAIELDPQRAQTYSDLAEALAKVGKLEEAIASGEKAVSLDPYDVLARKTLIDCLIAAKRYDKAVAAMDRYLELFPDDGFMRKMLAIATQ